MISAIDVGSLTLSLCMHQVAFDKPAFLLGHEDASLLSIMFIHEAHLWPSKKGHPIAILVIQPKVNATDWSGFHSFLSFSNQTTAGGERREGKVLAITTRSETSTDISQRTQERRRCSKFDRPSLRIACRYYHQVSAPTMSLL